MKKLVSVGLIAGGGTLPILFAEQARAKGLRVHTVAIAGVASRQLENISDSIRWISIGQLGTLLQTFKKRGVHQAVMHGKVQHSTLFKNFKLDLKAFSIWIRLKDRSGEGLLKALADELDRHGIHLMDCRYLMDVITPVGFSVGKIKSDDRDCIAYGVKQAKAVARLGIGQTVVVKKSAIVAVEAMEGTDMTIERAGKCVGSGTVVVKVSSPKQDWRFDVPTVGPETIQKLMRIKAKGLVLEGGKSFLLEKEELVRLARKYGFFIHAI